MSFQPESDLAKFIAAPDLISRQDLVHHGLLVHQCIALPRTHPFNVSSLAFEMTALGSKQFSVCVEVNGLGYWSFGVVVLSEVGFAAS